ncbi:ActS/PrrB/RegB family redox-sensitive histidine kinase [Lacibacterium aquatile]|uniref:histidine kinase n=1 Tax=Lacibacterium aquatile TaxID=1168082 RepID=A0ABW5DMB4_9PROT
MDETGKRKDGEAATLTAEALPATRGAVRVRTLLYLRWVAIVGQGLSLYVTEVLLKASLPLLECLSVIAAAGLMNLHLLLSRSRQDWLGRRTAATHLAFDILQVSALLHLTGGLTNPFAVIIIVPVTISATILPLRSTAILGALAIGSITALAFWHRPIPWPTPDGFELPRLYQGGLWVAIASATVFIGAYAWRVAAEARTMAAALSATKMALAREQQLSAVGGLAAAAAHELGSPLSTIAVVAKELSREVELDDPLRADIDLLVSEAARCRDILARLSEAPHDDQSGNVLDRPAVSALITELASEADLLPVPVSIVIEDDCEGSEPQLARTPELVHGIGNFIQNAAQFASGGVKLRLYWDREEVALAIDDDGPGFPPWMLAQLGEPYVSTRAGDGGHMGLGVFIATTLLSHSGGRVQFFNREEGGARVLITWERSRIELLRLRPNPAN